MCRREMTQVPVLVAKDQRRFANIQKQHPPVSRRQFEGRFQALAQRTFDAAFECHIRKGNVEVNEALTRALRPLIGFSPQRREFPVHWQQFVHPEDHEVVATHLKRVLCGRRDLCVFRVHTPLGRVRWFGLLTRRVAENEDEGSAYVYGLIRDYSARSGIAASCTEERVSVGTPPLIGCPTSP